jgi:hypothetical protein
MNPLKSFPRTSIALSLILVVFALIRLVSPSAANQMEKIHFDSVSRQSRQMAPYLPGKGKVVLLVFDAEITSTNNASLKQRIQTLKREGVKVLHLEQLVPDPQSGWSTAASGFPYLEFLRVVEEHPNAEAVISLCGAPYLPENTESLPAPDSLPPLLLPRVINWTPSLNAMLQSGRVSMALVPRQISGDPPPFHILTPEGIHEPIP